METLLTPAAPEQLGIDVRSAHGELIRRRRQVVTLDLVAAGCMGRYDMFRNRRCRCWMRTRSMRAEKPAGL